MSGSRPSGQQEQLQHGKRPPERIGEEDSSKHEETQKERRNSGISRRKLIPGWKGKAGKESSGVGKRPPRSSGKVGSAKQTLKLLLRRAKMEKHRQRGPINRSRRSASDWYFLYFWAIQV